MEESTAQPARGFSHCCGVGWGGQECGKGMGTQVMDELVRSPSHLPGCALAFSAVAALAGQCEKLLPQNSCGQGLLGVIQPLIPLVPHPVLKPVRLVLPAHTGPGCLEAQQAFPKAQSTFQLLCPRGGISDLC